VLKLTFDTIKIDGKTLKKFSNGFYGDNKGNTVYTIARIAKELKIYPYQAQILAEECEIEFKTAISGKMKIKVVDKSALERMREENERNYTYITGFQGQQRRVRKKQVVK